MDMLDKIFSLLKRVGYDKKKLKRIKKAIESDPKRKKEWEKLQKFVDKERKSLDQAAADDPVAMNIKKKVDNIFDS